MEFASPEEGVNLLVRTELRIYISMKKVQNKGQKIYKSWFVLECKSTTIETIFNNEKIRY